MSASRSNAAEVLSFPRDGHAVIYRLPGAAVEPVLQPTGGPDTRDRMRLVAPHGLPYGVRRVLLVTVMALVYAATFAVAWLLVHGG